VAKVKPAEPTVNTKGQAADCVPDVPTILALYWPATAVLVDVSVIELVLVVGLGEKEAVTPLGRPVTENVTAPVNPNCGFRPTL
jgi:hypothetical protein